MDTPETGPFTQFFKTAVALSSAQVENSIAKAGKWDAAKHPRGPNGRFIEAGDIALMGDGSEVRITEVKPNGTVKGENAKGKSVTVKVDDIQEIENVNEGAAERELKPPPDPKIQKIVDKKKANREAAAQLPKAFSAEEKEAGTVKQRVKLAQEYNKLEDAHLTALGVDPRGSFDLPDAVIAGPMGVNPDGSIRVITEDDAITGRGRTLSMSPADVAAAQKGEAPPVADADKPGLVDEEGNPLPKELTPNDPGYDPKLDPFSGQYDERADAAAGPNGEGATADADVVGTDAEGHDVSVSEDDENPGTWWVENGEGGVQENFPNKEQADKFAQGLVAPATAAPDDAPAEPGGDVGSSGIPEIGFDLAVESVQATTDNPMAPDVEDAIEEARTAYRAADSSNSPGSITAAVQRINEAKDAAQDAGFTEVADALDAYLDDLRARARKSASKPMTFAQLRRALEGKL